MTTPRHVRTSAARLTGSSEERTGAVSSFQVNTVEYARLTRDEVSFWIGAHELERRRVDVPAARDDVSEAGTPGMTVALGDVNGMQVNALLTVAHTLAAPATEAPVAPEGGGDLPGSLGRPALRALNEAGHFTLESVAAVSPSELGALHGVGPKALRLLTEVFAAEGRDWA